jgi:L-2-hydroxyglutarate oxidase LhgO
MAQQYEVTGLLRHNGRICGVRTHHADWASRFVINAAGLHADTIMAQADLPGSRIQPRHAL